MANQGGNSTFTNVRRSSMFACRRCDKVYPSARSLIEHFESHDEDFAHERQNHQRTNYSPYQRERSNLFHQRVASSTIGIQRYHPYLPNGQARETNPIANTNFPFLVPTQNPQLSHQQKNNPVTTLTSEITSQVIVNQPIETPNFQLGMIGSSSNISLQQLVSDLRSAHSRRVQKQKGYDETADKRTIWYLGQLEKPIPKTIDLERHENVKLSLRC